MQLQAPTISSWWPVAKHWGSRPEGEAHRRRERLAGRRIVADRGRVICRRVTGSCIKTTPVSAWLLWSIRGSGSDDHVLEVTIEHCKPPSRVHTFGSVKLCVQSSTSRRYLGYLRRYVGYYVVVLLQGKASNMYDTQPIVFVATYVDVPWRGRRTDARRPAARELQKRDEKPA